MQVGDKVKTGVYVCGKWQGMYTGVIKEDCNGCYKVDIGSINGCAAWVIYENSTHIMLYEDYCKSINEQYIT